MQSIEELDRYIATKIQGGFGRLEMGVLKEEIEKLKPGDVYVEVGVNEGRSARVAYEYAKPDVYKLWIDIKDVNPVSGVTIGRGDFMEQEEMVGIGKKGFYIHGDADEFIDFLSHIRTYGETQFIDLIFIDGHHDYESVKKNTLKWEPFVHRFSGVLLFHDYDHPDTKKWLDEYYRDQKEVIGGKIVRVRK